MLDRDETPRKATPSARKKAAAASDTASTASAVSTADSELTTAASDDTDETADTEVVDDGLPHPRVGHPGRGEHGKHKMYTDRDQPFESRRDFFNRTSNEWQEILMTNLRWKNIKVEAMTIKEIKTKAFELSEEKWWDCREEITALEDEQEAAGIGEVVSLADRGGGGGGGGGDGSGGGGPRRR